MGPKFDLRDLRAFLAVADEGNLGRAAEHLHISASPLSRHMLELEARLGLILFERERKRLRLTTAGYEFREKANGLLSHAAEVDRAIALAAAGEAGRIALGYVPGAMWSGLLPDLVRRVRADLPNVAPRFYPMRSREGAEALCRGVVDIAFVHTLPDPDDGARFASTLVHRDAFALVLPVGHSLVDIHEASMAPALGEQDWIALDATRSPNFRSAFLAACGAYGFAPRIRHEAPDLLSVLGFVEAGLGVALLQSAIRRIAPPGIVFVDLPGFQLDVRVHVLWRQGNLSKVAERLITIAKSAVGRVNGAPPFVRLSRAVPPR